MRTEWFRRSPSVLWRNNGDDVLVAGVAGDQLQVLSGTAGHVWSLLDAPRTLTELVAILDDQYQAPSGVIARDVARLLQDLQRVGLVDTVADGG